MNVAEQETLFKQVKLRFGLLNRWSSGYVAGINDADKDRTFFVDSDLDYEAGYGQGYADAGGDREDAIPTMRDYRWWEK